MRLISGKKIKAISDALSKEGIGIALFINAEPVTDPNIAYLTGFFGMGSGVLVLKPHKSMTLLVPELDYGRALEQASADEAVKTGPKDRGLKAIRWLLPSAGKIGVVKSSFTIRMMEGLSVQKSRLADIGKIMSDERAVKEPKEIEAFEKSAAICNLGIKYLQESLRTGVAAREVSAGLEHELAGKGSERVPFDTIVTSGAGSAHIHPYPPAGTKRIGSGLGIVDFGAVYKGFVTDVTVPFSAGQLSVKEKRMIKTVLSVHDDTIVSIKNGVGVKSLFENYEKSVKSAGFEIKHSLGHGLGIETHESPTIYKTDTRLRENMALTIEPGVYEKNTGGCRLENDVLVLKNSCRVLTKSRLISL